MDLDDDDAVEEWIKEATDCKSASTSMDTTVGPGDVVCDGICCGQMVQVRRRDGENGPLIMRRGVVLALLGKGRVTVGVFSGDENPYHEVNIRNYRTEIYVHVSKIEVEDGAETQARNTAAEPEARWIARGSGKGRYLMEEKARQPEWQWGQWE